MACVGVLGSQDAAVRKWLPEVTSFSISAGTLTLIGTGNAALLTYSSGLTSLEGTTWSATGINNGAGGVVSTTLTEHVAASFGPAGAFSGFGGCNKLSGTYETSNAHALRLTGLTASHNSCSAELDTLESEYVAALVT